MESRINKYCRFHVASSLVLLATFFNIQNVMAQMPDLFRKFVEKQGNVKSGYVKMQRVSTDIYDTTGNKIQRLFFITTPKDIKYLAYDNEYLAIDEIYCKSESSCITNLIYKDTYDTLYLYYDNKKKKDFDIHMLYPVMDFSTSFLKNKLFERVAPKINKKNVRYKIIYPDQKEDMLTNIWTEYEFDRKTFSLIQEEQSFVVYNAEQFSSKIDVIEQCLYDYIHPDILDTISLTFELLKKGYDKQTAMQQSKKDSAFIDSVISSVSKNTNTWTEKTLSSDYEEKDTILYMPYWKFPLLSGDSIFSDSIKSRFLLIDMWYTSCYPCRLSLRDLSSMDSLYDEKILKIISINVFDKDISKMDKVITSTGVQCDVACAYNSNLVHKMSKSMGGCEGYPQIYLIDMENKRVIWHSCGWYAGFIKDVEGIIMRDD